jgi:hypothetical protein
MACAMVSACSIKCFVVQDPLESDSVGENPHQHGCDEQENELPGPHDVAEVIGCSFAGCELVSGWDGRMIVPSHSLNLEAIG